MQIEVSIKFDEAESQRVASLLRLFANEGSLPSRQSADSSSADSALAKFLESPAFRAEGDVLGRFKRILSWLYQDEPDYFDTMVEEYLERVTGRICLGRSEDEVNDSGTNVKAQQIPNTPYWVETNSDTAKKKRHLEEWMIGLARPDAEIKLAVAALGESQSRS